MREDRNELNTRRRTRRDHDGGLILTSIQIFIRSHHLKQRELTEWESGWVDWFMMMSLSWRWLMNLIIIWHINHTLIDLIEFEFNCYMIELTKLIESFQRKKKDWNQFNLMLSDLSWIILESNWMKFIWFMRFLFHFFIEIWMQYIQWNRSFGDWIWLILFGNIQVILSYLRVYFRYFLVGNFFLGAQLPCFFTFIPVFFSWGSVALHENIEIWRRFMLFSIDESSPFTQ